MLTLYSENLMETGKFDYLLVDERVILKWIKKIWVQGCGPDLSCTLKDGVEGVCEHGDEPLGIMKCDDVVSLIE
jgi:hypothetical protein